MSSIESTATAVEQPQRLADRQALRQLPVLRSATGVALTGHRLVHSLEG